MSLVSTIYQFFLLSILIEPIFFVKPDAPSFKEAPKSIEADNGEKINLACDADGNPLEIIWVYDPIDKVSSS